MREISLYLASAPMALWKIAHLYATGSVVSGFGQLTLDNRRIVTMEWAAEGVALISLAGFVAAPTMIQKEAALSTAVYAIAIATLIVFAILSLFTVFRIAYLPFRLCPFVLGVSAALIAWGPWG